MCPPPTEDSKLLQLRCCLTFQGLNDSLKKPKRQKTFSFLSKEATTSVNQQMCQSTNPILNNKGAPLCPCLATIRHKHQSTNVSINFFATQQEEESYLLPLPTTKQFKSINRCVDQSLLDLL